MRGCQIAQPRDMNIQHAAASESRRRLAIR
jgi:hypothetical protein